MVEEIWLPQIDKQVCTGCGDCIAVCPTEALALAAGIAVVVNPEACTYSGVCESICPVDAIALPYLVLREAD